MKCPYCGSKNQDDALFCAHCGEKLQNADEHIVDDPADDYSDDDFGDDFGDEFEDDDMKVSKIALAILGLIVVATIVIFIIALSKTKIRGGKDTPTPKEAASTTETTEKANEEAETETEEPPEEETEEIPQVTESENPVMSAAREGLAYAEDIEPLEYNGHVYGVFNFHELGLESFDECEDFCRKIGGHLAVIESEEENKEVYQYLLKNDRDHTFIGFTDQEEEGIWEWVDYSDVLYTNWSAGQPNNKKGKENYAQYDGKKGGTWNDAEFGAQSWRFLCEWE